MMEMKSKHEMKKHGTDCVQRLFFNSVFQINLFDPFFFLHFFCVGVDRRSRATGSDLTTTPMNHLPSFHRHEQLISLEEELDSSFSDVQETPNFSAPLPNSLPQFETDINKLKQQSLAKFKKRWHEILAKYSAVDDELQSDEIDLHTGKLVVDNGHLKSMAEHGQKINGVRVHGSIWAGDYDSDRDARVESQSERRKRKFKQKMRELLKSENRFHTSSSFNTTDEERDDKSIASSPTKRFGLLSNQSSPLKSSRNSPSKFPTSLDLSPLKRKASLPPGYFSPTKKVQNSRKLEEKELPEKRNNMREEQTQDQALQLDSPDDLFVVSDLTEPIPIALFSCAFPNCNFSSECKSTYRTHLLQKHQTELAQLGYPVASSSSQTLYGGIPELTVLKLILHFPLQISTLGPFTCNKPLGRSKCHRVFVNPEQLARHREKYPRECCKRQVLLCPLLGCEFMTDEGFGEWKTHVDSHEKYVKIVEPAGDVMENVDDFFDDSETSLRDEEGT